MASKRYLLVNTAVLFGTPEYMILQLIADAHKDAFRGIGYFEGRDLSEIYAVFEFDDPEKLDAVKWVFEKLIHEKLGYKTKKLVQVRANFPRKFRLVVGHKGGG